MIIDQLNQIWTGLLEFTAKFVIPAWEQLIALLPVFLLIGVVGPILTILMLAWLRYAILKPRVTAGFVDPRRPAAIGDDGLEATDVGGVGHGIDHGQPVSRSRGTPRMHQVLADKARTARDQNVLHRNPYK